MAYSIIANGAAASPDTSSVTTGSLNTTGASLLVAFVSAFTGAADDGALTDSKSNSWTKLTSRDVGACRLSTWYSEPSSVGSGHTFTFSKGVSYPAIAVIAAGPAAVSPKDQENGNAEDVDTTIQPGSVTPSENNELLLTGLAGLMDGSSSINSGFSILDQIGFGSGVNIGVASAYLIQTTAGAVNPTWTSSGATQMAAEIVTFKLAAGGGGGFIAFPHPRGESGGMHRLSGGLNH